MFIDGAMNSILQRSAMSRAMVRETNSCFAPWSDKKSFGSRAFYKHLAPNGAKGQQALLSLINP